MMNIANPLPAQEPIEVSREARKKKLRDAAYAALSSAKNIPGSLQGLDNMVDRMFSLLECQEAGIKPSKWDEDPFRAPSYSAAPRSERERIGAMITAAIEESNLTVHEAYSAVNGAICDLARQYPGH